jgi:hypothetical protein
MPSSWFVQDYIMRMIQQVAQMLAVLMGHRHAGRREEAAQEIERACLLHAGVPMSMVRLATPEALRQFLPAGGHRNLARDIMLAELLMQDAELMDEQGEAAAALHSRSHAFCLINDAVDSLAADDTAHYRSTLDSLAKAMDGFPLDSYVAVKHQAWLEKRSMADNLICSAPPASAI